MSVEKSIKKRICYILFGWVFALLALFAPIAASTPVFAEPETETETSEIEETTETEPAEEPENPVQPAGTTETPNQVLISDFNGDICKQNLGAVGWLVCPAMNVITSATDSLYTVIKDLLVIKPLEANNESPIYIIWKYCLGISNMVFVIFLLVVVFSQITGIGISNYGIKKILPKLIVVAILINLSFLICTILVDISNIVGSSLRSIFENVPITIGDLPVSQIPMRDVVGAVLGTTALAGVTIAVSAASLWMLIPTLLAGLASVVSGLITIALRQTVVTLLVMISPLAFVCNMLPNTKDLYTKWKNLFKKMLVFYPLFSLLFGASNLAGWAIIASASSNSATGMFMVVLGLAVQIMPLFFSWSLMKMSGTFLGDINAKIRGLADKPIATNRAWAESHRDLSKARKLALDNRYRTPSTRLMQYLSDRKISRETDTKEYRATAVNRGLAYNANRHYDKNGKLNRDGEEAYNMQTQNQKYQTAILRDKNTFNEGVAKFARDDAHRKYLEQLDQEAIDASDEYAMQVGRSAAIEYGNSKGRQQRFNNAMNAHIDEENRNVEGYNRHVILERTNALRRYEQMKQAMLTQDDVNFGINLIAADAASAYSAQAAIMQNKFEKYSNLTVPTNDIVKRLEELTRSRESSKNIDAIIGGMRILNARGDTSLVEKAIQEICEGDKLQLGTYASQAVASFLMFEVKDKDPTLRRFGKYINLETAKIYNDNENIPGSDEGRRLKTSVDMDEYVRGNYVDHYYIDENGQRQAKIKQSKFGLTKLITGTSFSGVEREAYDTFEKTIRDAYIQRDSENNVIGFDVRGYNQKRAEAWTAALPNIVSDQFAYLSGSEQINALARTVTSNPYDKMPDELKNVMTDEDKALLEQAQEKRVGEFVNAQVYSQIARSKSDMLAPIKQFYTKKAAEQYAEECEGMTDAERAEFVRSKAADMFKDHLQPGIYDSLLDNARKGNLPDTKSGLVEFLDLQNKEEQDRVASERYILKNGKNKGKNVDPLGQEGVIHENEPFQSNADPQGAQLRNDLEQNFRNATTGAGQNTQQDIRTFFSTQMRRIDNDPTVNAIVKNRIKTEIGNNLDSYSTIAEVYEAINQIING